MRLFRSLKLAIVLGMAAVISACAIPDGARTGLRALDNSSGLISFDSDEFKGRAEQRVVYANTIEREEYALFKSRENQAEFIYITTRHLHLTNLVIDRLFDIDAAMGGFRHNRIEKPTLGEAFLYRSNGIRYWAKAFQLTNTGDVCGALSGSWDAPAEDSRPSKALFGYFCRSGTVPLSSQQIMSTIDQIGIRGITSDAIDGNIEYPKLADAPTQLELLTRAQGQSGGRDGNTRFPYHVVRYFNRGRSCLFPSDC